MGQAARQIDPKDIEKNFKQSEAIIHSMTLKERRDPDILNASRRRRIAAGSGMEVQDVNRLIGVFLKITPILAWRAAPAVAQRIMLTSIDELDFDWNRKSI